MLILSQREVEELLDPDALVDALAAAMVDLSAGRASAPNRVAALVQQREGLLAAMPGYAPSAADAPTIAILGTGVQARAHARAVTRVRRFSELRIAGRDPVKARELAAELRGELDLRITAASSFAQACAGASVICATTHALEPIVRRQWLAPGVHVNSVGYNPQGREVDDLTVSEALVVVESRAAALAPPPAGANDLLQPIERGLIDADHIHAELGELVDGTRPGRSSAEQITLYKSVGVAVQDVAAAAVVLRGTRERGVGQEVEL